MKFAKWYFNNAIHRLVPMRWRRVGKRGPSMVLLLRNPHEFSEEEIRRAVERAWAVSFSVAEGSTRRIMTTENAVFVQAGPHRLSFVNYPKPYEEKPEEDLDWLPKLSQQQAWAEHTACCWVNYATSKTDLEVAHSVLAKVVAELLDENCTGVYIPTESSLIPAEDAFTDLQTLGSYRSSALIPE